MYSRPQTRDEDFEALFHRYGGGRRPRRDDVTAATTVMTVDSGEEVLERPVDPIEEEYVVDRPEPPAPPTTPVAPAPPDALMPAKLPPEPPAAEPPEPSREPFRERAPEPTLEPATPPEADLPEMRMPAPEPLADIHPPPPPAPPEPPAPVGGAGLTSADLAADMQAILGGAAVYDERTGRVRPRTDADPAPGSAASEPVVTDESTGPVERPLPEAANEQSIFDRIARSMEHANSFDLGTHELSRRFNAFEQADTRRRTRPVEPLSGHAASPDVGPPASSAPPTEPVTPGPVAGLTAEDYAAVYDRQAPGRSYGCACSGASAVVSTDGVVATPMFDTGEHVLAGGDLYADQLLVGRSPGVRFSYGQIIAMGDFYGRVEDLRSADPAELTRLKTLIERNTRYYAGNKANRSLDVSNEEWDRATGGRYVRLAEGNYDHFAPAALLGLSGPQHEPDHKQRWSELHRQALREMQQLVLDHPDSSPLPVGPLTVNAFGDHFLTDAFAAGHLVNKEVLMNRFRSRFFSGGRLTSQADRFFDQVADRAWSGDVRDKMRRLEPTNPPEALCAFGWCAPITPNIRTAGMFAEVLKQAAVAEPGKIANLAVKVLHDKFNADGIEVVNDVDPAWPLTGDGHLNDDTKRIMRRAVEQSVANLHDSSILVSNADFAPLIARVWRLTPRPTPASRVTLTRAMDTYTDPASSVFVAATADLIKHQIDMLIRALVDSGRMREGGGI